jgi:hypothetical protein
MSARQRALADASAASGGADPGGQRIRGGPGPSSVIRPPGGRSGPADFVGRTLASLGRCAALVVAGGCGIERDDFFERFSEELCQAYEKCEEGLLIGEWGTRDACEQAQLDVFYGQEAINLERGCTWDDAAARQCLNAFRGRTCNALDTGEWSLSCDGLWSCPADAQTGADERFRS